jgi:hypothetical protein
MLQLTRARSIPLILCGLALCLLLPPGTAQATQILLKTPSEMGRSSELVVQGRVAAVHSFWNAGGTKILTEVRVDVDRSHKGQAKDTVRIVQLGGEVDGVRMTVAGSPSWRTGEEVLVFLERMRSGDHRVAGFSQGKFLVERDARSGEAFVRRPALIDTELMARAGMAAPKQAENALRVPLRRFLDESLLQIREED